MTSDVLQVEIIERLSWPYRQNAQELINSIRDPEAFPCAQFRLDDDDAVGVEFFADLRTVSEPAHGLFEYNGKFAVDFNIGFAPTASAEGLKTTFLEGQLWTPALAIILSQASRRSILNYGRQHLRPEISVVRIPNKNMFIRNFYGN